MLIELYEDYYANGGLDDIEMFNEFCANYRRNDYMHCIPINAPEGTGFEREDD